MLVLFLLLTSGQSMQMIEQAYATCCPVWLKGCITWHGLVYGSAEMLGTVGPSPMVRIRDDKGFSRDIKASQAIVDAFKTENITIDYGFSIVSAASGEPVLIGFAPVTKDHKQPQDKTLRGAGGVVADYNKEFEVGANPPPNKND
jgi:hypothetical protein